MMGGAGRFGNFMNQETLKPKSISETLARLGGYFARFAPMLLLAAVFVITATWAQVTTPEITGQATDCFLVPAGASAFAGFPGAEQQAQNSGSACWLGNDPSTLSGTKWIIAKFFSLGGFKVPDGAAATTTDRASGLGRLVLIFIGLSVTGSLMNGLTFFTMSWTGQHVLRQLRLEVFNKLHQLSLSFYADHEAGDLMSRITNDTSAIEQAISFALVNVLGGILLLVWVAFNMISANLPFALLSLTVAPLMFLATLYFSEQARKAFRRSRQEIGNVNAELQESIAAVREVQAFNRADENIEQFKTANAANRDANVRAVS
ncbi:MAG TPA: ABC transporter transmembrane domain-containing protein, partial [Anaerolineales bacterium]